MSLIPESFINAVTSIGILVDDDSAAYIGSGFIVEKTLSHDLVVNLLITNKHVLEGKKEVLIRVINTDGKPIHVSIPLTKNKKRAYSIHPNPDVDIAAMVLHQGTFEKNNLIYGAINIDKDSICSNDYIKEGGGEGSGIFMLGFPLGLIDEDSLMPICRAGSIARIAKSEIGKTKRILLDLQNFPGSSGSPIVSKPESYSVDGTKAFDCCKLIGIIHSYIPYRETLTNSQTGEIVEVRSENSGIAIANPVEFIHETIQIEMEKYADQIEEEIKKQSTKNEH